MTPKQEERIRNKIAAVKKALADGKRHWGCYDDSSGLRYYQPELYLKIKDYKGASRYFTWFNKIFPDDSCYAEFFIEWAITLYKTGKIEAAEKKVLQAYISNEFNPFEPDLNYSEEPEELRDFAGWLKPFTQSKTFIKFSDKYKQIEQQLENEPVGERRSELVDEQYSLLDNYPELAH